MSRNEAPGGNAWSPPGPLGARLSDGVCSFRVWAPAASRVDVKLADRGTTLPMTAEGRGYFTAVTDAVAEGALYRFVLDGDADFPDPASRAQPDGVHGASAVASDSFDWSDATWTAPARHDLVMYELHVGTFTPEGTFDGVISQLDRLRDLGVNCIELLPVSQFPGSRNWGYDGVYPFAVQHSYGGVAGLKRLVNAAHAADIAVALDVVYNHLGPEGNYLSVFGPYFTEQYRTPWGAALNFDGASSDHVRAFFIQSAVQWADEFHVDALRFDAVHAIVDASARPFLAELTDELRAAAQRTGRTTHLIAESDLSDPKVIRPTAHGGLGFDAQWLDDFHHAVHSAVTGETQGYYADYGGLSAIARALQQAYVFAGDYSEHRGRRHGAPLDAIDPGQFVVFVQNHDQIGNRLKGDRLSATLPFDALKLIAACTLLSPYIPLLFMGEEYGETAPFPFFVSHGDEALVQAVREGRKAEFASFGWSEEPPDPQGEATFRSAVLDPAQASAGNGRALLDLHRDLLQVRREYAAIRAFDALETSISGDAVLAVTRHAADTKLLLLLNFSDREQQHEVTGAWRGIIATDDVRYGGLSASADTRVEGAVRLSAYSAILLVRELA